MATTTTPKITTPTTPTSSSKPRLITTPPLSAAPPLALPAALHPRHSSGSPPRVSRLHRQRPLQQHAACQGDWFADRMDDWSATLATGRAHVHVFRKTSLQYVRSGEDVNRQVANDARVSESVLMTSYVSVKDRKGLFLVKSCELSEGW